MRIALIGVSGSGKGDQAKLLAEKYRISHISTGGLLRQAAQSKQLSKEDRLALEEGRMVSDEVVKQLLLDRLRARDTRRGFVIDGHPRNIPQAQILDSLLGMLGRPLQIAIYIKMEDELLIKRNVGRQACTSCGKIYNRHFAKPQTANVCDVCGSSLEVRKSDTPRKVALRVAEQKESIVPLITYFRAQHKLRTVDAGESDDVIHDQIASLVDLEIRPLEIDTVVSASDDVGEGDRTVIAGGQINKVAPAKKKKAKPAAKSKVAKKPAPKKETKKKPVAKKKVAEKKVSKKKVAKKPVTKKVAKKKPAKKKAAKKKVAKKTTKKTAKKTSARKSPRRR